MPTDISLSDVPYEATLLADWLVQGKPTLGWRGDPRLELRIGVLQAQKNGNDRKGRFRTAGEVLARRYEVWRHNEDGTDTNILSRKLTDFADIIPALVQIDPRTPGHVGTIERIEKENKLRDKHAADAVQEAHGEATEHLWKLVADRENGRTTFRGMPGSNPDKQD